MKTSSPCAAIPTISRLQSGIAREEVLEVGRDLLGALTGPIGKALDGVLRPEELERLDVVVVHALDGPADEVGV